MNPGKTLPALVAGVSALVLIGVYLSLATTQKVQIPSACRAEDI
jgi:hypothetical protein